MIRILKLALAALSAAAILPAASPVTQTILAPTSVTDVTGTHSGSVTALALKDQTGTASDTSKYVQFGIPAGQSYQGYRSYFLPGSISPSAISTITVKVAAITLITLACG